MPTDQETLTQELLTLMQAHNRWSARVAALRRLAAGPEEGGGSADLQAELTRLEGELAAAQRLAAEWEQKARQLSQLVYKERSERTRRIRELELELRRIKEERAVP